MSATQAPPTDRHLAALLGGLERVWTGDLPAGAVAAAKLVVADYLGTALAGAYDANHRRLLAGLLATAPAGQCAVLGAERRADLSTAVFLNASAGPALELDDRLPEVRMHAGVHVVPLALACAEEAALPGLTALRSVVIGYEAAVLLGHLLPGRPDWLHPHGYLMTIATAVAAANLRGLPFTALPDVVNGAATITPLAPFDAAPLGATVRNAYPGFACDAALRVVSCVAAGLSGPPGGLAGLALRVGRELAGPALPALPTLAVERAEMKVLPCCASLHPYVRALRALLAHEPGVTVERVVVTGPAPLARFMTTHPHNLLAAQFSLPFALAHEVVRGLSIAVQLDPADAAVAAMATRVEIIADPRESQVAVVTRDGRTIVAPTSAAPTLDVTAEAVVDKLRALNRERAVLAEALWDYAMRLDHEPRVRLPLAE